MGTHPIFESDFDCLTENKMKIFLFLVSLVFANSNGWNDDINWLTLDGAKEAAAENKKPIMLIIHKSWCGACKALKPKFAADKEIEALSASFNMVNTLDDAEPKGSEYTPDGGYIPRILFLNSQGTVMADEINEGGNAQYKFYYPQTSSIITSMKRISSNFAKDEL